MSPTSETAESSEAARTAESPRVSICIASYKRPDGLKRLLDALAKLEFDVAPLVEICVADNDPERSGTRVCDEVRADYRWPLRCEHEPQRGLSSARNRSVALVSMESDFVAFLDDDEEPNVDWLEQLLETQKDTGADVVGGPVLARFEETPPQWVERGGYFSTERMPTGTELPFAATGNVLVRAQLLRDLDGPFDLRFSHAGGEDTHLFIRLQRSGNKIVWCDEAVVHEYVPASRVGLRWLLRRGARSFGTYSLCRRELDGWKTLPFSVAKGLVRIGIGILLLPTAIVGGKPNLVAGLLNISRGTGRIVGWFGHLPKEYGDAQRGAVSTS